MVKKKQKRDWKRFWTEMNPQTKTTAEAERDEVEEKQKISLYGKKETKERLEEVLDGNEPADQDQHIEIHRIVNSSIRFVHFRVRHIVPDDLEPGPEPFHHFSI